MDDYSQILNYAIPVFFLLILVELAVSRWQGKTVLRHFDTISSLSSGMTNVTKDVLGLAVVIVSYEWMASHLAVYQIAESWVVYVLAFIGLDFAGYWSHRFEHEINLLWNRHVIHHSSEEFNLACALRQNVSAIFGIFFFLMIPMALIGVPAKVVAIVAPIHFFVQFWYHTRLIDKMGFLEWIIVTPSHHRVHHAINDEYIDKNFSQVLIIWDRLFGTFQEERADVPAVYGIKKQVATWNPLIINYQHFSRLLADAWHTKAWMDKIKVFYMPTGWRPADRIAEAPIEIIDDPYHVQKYDTPASTTFILWMWVQLGIGIVLTLYLFSQLSVISTTTMILSGVFVVVNVFAYTSLMDRSKLGIPFSMLTLLLAFAICYSSGGWLSLSMTMAMGVIAFYVISLLASFYFMKTEALDSKSVLSLG